jgi:hypothetical protein
MRGRAASPCVATIFCGFASLRRSQSRVVTSSFALAARPLTPTLSPLFGLFGGRGSAGAAPAKISSHAKAVVQQAQTPAEHWLPAFVGMTAKRLARILRFRSNRSSGQDVYQ